MIGVLASSFKVTDPQQRAERIKNDLKYSWAMGTTASLGTAAAVIGFERPDLYVKGYKNASNFVKTQVANAQLSKAGQTVTQYVKNASNFVKGKLNQFAGSVTGGKILNKIGPKMNAIGHKLARVKTAVADAFKPVSNWLAKVPAKYKIAGTIALATMALVSKLSHDHAYNAGKIDGHYEK